MLLTLKLVLCNVGWSKKTYDQTFVMISLLSWCSISFWAFQDLVLTVCFYVSGCQIWLPRSPCLQHFPVVSTFGGQTHFNLERAAVPFFGTKVNFHQHGNFLVFFSFYANATLTYALKFIIWKIHLTLGASWETNCLVGHKLIGSMWKNSGIWCSHEWICSHWWRKAFVGRKAKHYQANLSRHAWPSCCWWAGQLSFHWICPYSENLG